ncbi:hypothetical protein WJX72_001823 [[Myrmecia] bisecta]|uniref:Metallo-beta-lactamase domain-containing protein n=1 Tax=[Myrmecia] bisecta TaxID=41462 RepID=A0AAW1P8H7_9CHLO
MCRQVGLSMNLRGSKPYVQRARSGGIAQRRALGTKPSTLLRSRVFAAAAPATTTAPAVSAEELNFLLKPKTLYKERLWVVPNEDPAALKNGILSYTYVILNENKEALLVDVVFDFALKNVRKLVESNGWTVKGLVLTHKHAVNQSHAENKGALQQVVQEYGIPVYLHPADTDSDMARLVPLNYQDPTNDPLISGFNLEVSHFPGHTEGHVLIYLKDHGGVVITGDSAVGSTLPQIAEGVESITRPPPKFNFNDELLRTNWADFDAPVQGFAAYHGQIFRDRKDLPELLKKDLTKPAAREGM